MMWLMKNNENLGDEESSNIWKIKLQENKKCDEPIMRRNSYMVLELNLTTYVVSEKEKKTRRRNHRQNNNNSERLDFVKNVLDDDYQWHRLKQRIVESRAITEMAVLEVAQKYLNDRRLSMLEKEATRDAEDDDGAPENNRGLGGVKRLWKRLSVDMVTTTTRTFGKAFRRVSA